MPLISDREFAIAEGIPQLDSTVTRPRDNLAIISGEGDGEDVVGVADETAGCGAGCEFPETECLVPGGGKGVGAV